jgi:hypothetical protein
MRGNKNDKNIRDRNITGPAFGDLSRGTIDDRLLITDFLAFDLLVEFFGVPTVTALIVKPILSRRSSAISAV